MICPFGAIGATGIACFCCKVRDPVEEFAVAPCCPEEPAGFALHQAAMCDGIFALDTGTYVEHHQEL